MGTLREAIEVVGASHTGLVRQNNEDTVWLIDRAFRSGVRGARCDQIPESGVLVAVADGVGGAAAGEVASRWVAERMAARLGAVAHSADAGTRSTALQKLGSTINRGLVRAAERDPQRRGMATTYTGLLYCGDWAVYLHAGDSRLYTFAEGDLRQITRDHTLREERGDPSIPGNIITNCFGSLQGFYLDVGPVDFRATELLLLCSDGLSDYADPTRIVEALAQGGELPHLARDLMQLALEGGGGDNVSLVLVRPVHA